MVGARLIGGHNSVDQNSEAREGDDAFGPLEVHDEGSWLQGGEKGIPLCAGERHHPTRLFFSRN